MSNLSTGKAGARVTGLLDAQSFVEIGGCVTARSTDFNLQTKETPADGVITGYGTIDGNLVYVYSQDASVLGGSMGEMHAKKISAIYNLAMKMGAPVIGLIDCAGLRLQEGTDALQAFGEMFLNQTNASGVIPQITAVFGTCGGGMGIVPALTDFTFMEKESAKLFVSAPNTLDGNIASACDTASAEYQSKSAGSVDVVATEEEILEEIRALVAVLPANNEDDLSYGECTDDLNRACESLENCTGDTAVALSMISDDNFFFETKRNYAKEMVTGFIRLNGTTVGCVANRSEVLDEEGNVAETLDNTLSSGGCQKAAEFVEFCDAFNIPVLTLTNVKGYKSTKCQERRIAKSVAEMTYAFANATVPKVNVIIGQALGTAYVAMNSKSIGADLVYAWPTATIGMMDSTAAARIMYADEIAKAEVGADVMNAKAKEYADLQSSAIAAAKRGYVDTIIDAQDTRKYVIGAFEMLYTKRDERPAKKHGTV